MIKISVNRVAVSFAGGLAAIKDVVPKASRDVKPLRASLTKLTGEFKELGIAMSPKTSGKERHKGRS